MKNKEAEPKACERLGGIPLFGKRVFAEKGKSSATKRVPGLEGNRLELSVCLVKRKTTVS